MVAEIGLEVRDEEEYAGHDRVFRATPAAADEPLEEFLRVWRRGQAKRHHGWFELQGTRAGFCRATQAAQHADVHGLPRDGSAASPGRARQRPARSPGARGETDTDELTKPVPVKPRRPSSRIWPGGTWVRGRAGFGGERVRTE